MSVCVFLCACPMCMYIFLLGFLSLRERKSGREKPFFDRLRIYFRRRTKKNRNLSLHRCMQKFNFTKTSSAPDTKNECITTCMQNGPTFWVGDISCHVEWSQPDFADNFLSCLEFKDYHKIGRVKL